MTDQIQTTTAAPNKTYTVGVIFSRWPLGDICAFLEDELAAQREQIGVMRIDRFKGQETNRTIVLLEKSLFNFAEKKRSEWQRQRVDFKLTEYELRPHNFPKEGYTRNFYIPLPEQIPGDEARAQLQNKIDVLVSFGMFGKDEVPRLKIPLKSRETGDHRGQAFITFARETSDQTVALARVLLSDTRLYTSEHDYELMKCFWAKHKEQRKEQGKKEQKGKKVPQKKSQGKKAPPKKGLVKTGTKGVSKTEKKPAPTPVVPIKPLAPGENQWAKPLVSVETPTEAPVENPKTPVETPVETTEATEVTVPGPLDFPTLLPPTN